MQRQNHLAPTGTALSSIPMSLSPNVVVLLAMCLTIPPALGFAVYLIVSDLRRTRSKRSRPHPSYRNPLFDSPTAPTSPSAAEPHPAKPL